MKPIKKRKSVGKIIAIIILVILVAIIAAACAGVTWYRANLRAANPDDSTLVGRQGTYQERTSLSLVYAAWGAG